MLRHAALPHAMWRHAMPCRVVPWWLPMLHARTMAIHVCPCCMPFRPCRACRPCHAMPCHAIPCRPCHAMPRHAMPCHAAPWPSTHAHAAPTDRSYLFALTCSHHSTALAPGVLYREMGNMERAMQCYQAALNARPNFPQARAFAWQGTWHCACTRHGMHGLPCKHMPCKPAAWCTPSC